MKMKLNKFWKEIIDREIEVIPEIKLIKIEGKVNKNLKKDFKFLQKEEFSALEIKRFIVLKSSGEIKFLREIGINEIYEVLKLQGYCEKNGKKYRYEIFAEGKNIIVNFEEINFIPEQIEKNFGVEAIKKILQKESKKSLFNYRMPKDKLEQLEKIKVIKDIKVFPLKKKVGKLIFPKTGNFNDLNMIEEVILKDSITKRLKDKIEEKKIMNCILENKEKEIQCTLENGITINLKKNSLNDIEKIKKCYFKISDISCILKFNDNYKNHKIYEKSITILDKYYIVKRETPYKIAVYNKYGQYFERYAYNTKSVITYNLKDMNNEKIDLDAIKISNIALREYDTEQENATEIFPKNIVPEKKINYYYKEENGDEKFITKLEIVIFLEEGKYVSIYNSDLNKEYENKKKEILTKDIDLKEVIFSKVDRKLLDKKVTFYSLNIETENIDILNSNDICYEKNKFIKFIKEYYHIEDNKIKLEITSPVKRKIKSYSIYIHEIIMDNFNKILQSDRKRLVKIRGKNFYNFFLDLMKKENKEYREELKEYLESFLKRKYSVEKIPQNFDEEKFVFRKEDLLNFDVLEENMIKEELGEILDILIEEEYLNFPFLNEELFKI